MRPIWLVLCLTGLAIGGSTTGGRAQAPAPTHTYALSLLGPPALPADFTHFPYVNPNAPKGGDVTLGAVGTFDSFNPFIVRGTAPADIFRVWDTLLKPNVDEPEAEYGHLVKDIEIPADHMGITFVLRPEARFHDGTPVTAQDVVWTFNTLRTQGRPFYRQYYADVANVSADGPLRVVFRFKTANRELAMILGEMPVLPEHWWAGRDFTAPLTDPPLGSGPYEVARFEFGRSLVLSRVKDYWARDLPTEKGLDNFDIRRTEYYRDATVAFVAFKAGQVDFRTENVSKDWATAYDFPAVQKGLVKKEAIPHHLPTGMQGFAMNTRRPVFANRLVREAMDDVFDFEWENKNLFYGAYTRTDSYFSNSVFASSGLPTGDELALLAPFRDKLPPEVFTKPFTLPVTDGSGNNREGLRAALALLRKAGWQVRDRKLVDASGQQMSFEILLDAPGYERLALPYVQWLARLGIDAHVRTVDPAQYQHLLDNFDYDMTMVAIGESDSPGNEQQDLWSCASARLQGSNNVMGVCDPVVDALVGDVVKAPDRAHLITAVRALDRVLLWGWYLVPQWHLQSVWVAYWDRFGRPSQPVRTGLAFDSWWVDAARAKVTDAARGSSN